MGADPPEPPCVGFSALPSGILHRRSLTRPLPPCLLQAANKNAEEADDESEDGEADDPYMDRLKRSVPATNRNRTARACSLLMWR